MLSASAPAKITLYLHITGKRADGYHLLDALVVFTELGDTLSVAPSDQLSLHVDGEFAPACGADDDNLVMRAARRLREVSAIQAGASIRLTKNLPVAAGLGGGSSDAAAVLKLLCHLWQLDHSAEALCELALPLGSDLPVCIHARPAYMSGIGEIIDPVPLSASLHLLLVNPRKPVATPAVYGRYTDEPRECLRPVLGPALINGLKATRNDLQRPAITLCADIAQVLLELETQFDCQLARLCGSGATCYGLFPDQESCERAAKRIRRNQPGWWVAPTRVLTGVHA